MNKLGCLEGYRCAGYHQGHIFEQEVNVKRGLDIWFPFLAGGIFFLVVSLIQWIFSEQVPPSFLCLVQHSHSEHLSPGSSHSGNEVMRVGAVIMHQPLIYQA